MYNPSYLIRSRHAVFYFRYPLTRYDNKRISISLDTRCPKEALLLSKALEYHALMIVNAPETETMDYAELRELLRKHFAEILERMKRKIEQEGVLPNNTVDHYKQLQYFAVNAIEENRDELYDQLFSSDDEMPDNMKLDTMLEPILTRGNISTQSDRKAYETLRSNYKYALNGYINALLDYNNNHRVFDFITHGNTDNSKPLYRKELMFSQIIPVYLKEFEGVIESHPYKEKKSYLEYLQEVFGADYLISDIDYTSARQVKDMLAHTPSNRSKKKETRDKPLSEQIETLKELGLKPLNSTTVNKYLGQISSMFSWAVKNKYISENPFKDMSVKVNKKEKRRNAFQKEEIAIMLNELSKMDTSKAIDKTRYWGILIAIYTGSRLNEFSSLTPDDVKQDKKTGIWYFEITDNEESKKVKTEASNRIVPIHKKLIELGFLDYVEQARKVIKSTSKQGEHPKRLLYYLTYTEGHGWGRKISRWFNNTFLQQLGLKTDKKTLHSLRHSFITSLSIASVEGATIKSMVGHEQGAVTERHYTHYGVDHLPVFKDAIEKLGY